MKGSVRPSADLSEERRAAHDAQLAVAEARDVANSVEKLVEAHMRIAETSLAEMRMMMERAASQNESMHVMQSNLLETRAQVQALSSSTSAALATAQNTKEKKAADAASTLATIKTKLDAVQSICKSSKVARSMPIQQLALISSAIAVAMSRPRLAGKIVQVLAAAAARILVHAYRIAPKIARWLHKLLGPLSSIAAALSELRVRCVPPAIAAFARVTTVPPSPVSAAPSLIATAAAEVAPAVLPLASLTSAGGVCVDSACTHFMTNSRRGLVGTLRSVAPLTFNTAAGPRVYDQAGTYERTLYGSNATALPINTTWYYDADLPFDIAGKPALKTHFGAVYIDGTDSSPAGILVPSSGKVLTLASTPNKLEWLGLSAPQTPDPRYPRVPTLPPAPEMQSSLVAAEAFPALLPASLVSSLAFPLMIPSSEMPSAFPLGSSGVGMGKLKLTDVQGARLTHSRLRHPSIRRMAATIARTKGLPRLTASGLKALNNTGCDLCNAYKIKLLTPKSKKTDSETDAQDDNPLALVYYDQFGRVSVPAIGTGYHYAHVFVVPRKTFRWVEGSKTLDAETVQDVLNCVRARLESRIGGKFEIMRVDSLGTTRGKLLTKWFNDALITRELTPPGQHSYLGDVEKEMYTLLVGTLIAMRTGRAPQGGWYAGMKGGSDSENILAARLNDSEPPKSGYERVLGFQPDADDMFTFYAPGRFALDRATLDNKWVERARAGYFLHRDLDFVLAGKKGAAVWWDGRTIRTCVQNFYICEERFFNLTAPDNALLPDFPLDSSAPADPLDEVVEPAEQSITAKALETVEKTCVEPPSTQVLQSRSRPAQEPISLTRNRRTPYQPVRFGSASSAPDIHPHALLLGSDEHVSRVSQLAALDCSALVLVHENESPASPRSVVNLFCGAYDNPHGISEYLRSQGVGVIDIDADTELGGGASADLTAPSLFADLRRMIEQGKVAGIIAQQPCSATSVARFRRNGPPIIFDRSHPDGRDDIPEAHKREQRISLLLAHHTCALMEIVQEHGGWFIAETPASRGNPSSIAYDPIASEHLNLFETAIYMTFRENTQALHATSAYCALREGPQKMTEWLLSEQLSALASKLNAAVCTHGIGHHPPQPPPKDADGTWSSSRLQVWPPELVQLLGPDLVAASPRGGPSLQLGPAHPSLFVSAAQEMYDEASHASQCESDPACFVAASSSWLRCPEGSDPSKWKVPGNPLELSQSTEAAFWETTELHEVDTLISKGWLRKEVISRTKSDRDARVWSSLFVYSLKQDADGVWWARARLCLRGGGNRRGIEYESKATPTPDWSSVLTVITITTITGAIDFHFDLAQFFQTIKCDAPGGPLKVRPPSRAHRFCAEAGCETVFVTEHWLQGAMGAGSAARREFDAHVAKIGVTRILECPSTYTWHHEDGMMRFNLHGDDGIGGAPSEKCLADFVKHLETRWSNIRVARWRELLGFEAAYDRDLRVTALTAIKQIEELRALVAGDVKLTPCTPATESLKALEPCVMPEVGTPEYEVVQERVHFLRVATGKMWHITKVRQEIIPALQAVSRLTHVPTPETVSCCKLIIWYLLFTIDRAKKIDGTSLSGADLLNPTPLPYGYELDPSAPLPAYLIELSDGDLRVAFSQCGVIVMFGRVAIVVLAFHQHSIAQNAHESEAFAASTGSSATIVMRERLQSLGFPQIAPTPCFGDSASTRDVANSEAALKRSMHIRRRVYIMQWAVFVRKLNYYKVKGKDNRADPLTKPWVSRKDFFAFRSFILNS